MDIERKLAIRVLNKAIGDTYFTDITKTINICSPVLLNNVTYISYNLNKYGMKCRLVQILRNTEKAIIESGKI